MDLKELEKVIRLVEKSEIAELEWEKNKVRIRVKKIPDGVTTQFVSLPSSAQTQAASTPVPAPQAAPVKTEAQTRSKEVLSPFVGTFYASPAPGAPKYIDAGARVKKGDVLCIIEAMKIMNEIEAEFPGKVVSILAKDGQPVQYGQPLFQVEP